MTALGGAGSTNTFYVDLPASEEAKWTIRWSRYGLATTPTELEQADDGDNERPAKRPRLEASKPDWLHASSADDAIESASVDLKAKQREDGEAKLGIGRRLVTIAVDDKLQRQLWLFETASTPSVEPAGLAEQDRGSFTFDAVYPPFAMPTHLATTDQDIMASATAFLAAAREAVLDSLIAQLAPRPDLIVQPCGSSLLLSSAMDEAPGIWCRPAVSFRPQGLVVTLAASPSLYRSLPSDCEEGLEVVLAPVGLPATVARTMADLPKSHHHLAQAFGVSLEQVWLVVRIRAGEGDEVLWPSSLCLTRADGEEKREQRRSQLTRSLLRDRKRHRPNIEETAIAASAYIDAVARERDRERKERAMAAVRSQPTAAATPGSTVASTPIPYPEDPGTVASAGTAPAARTPGSATQADFALTNTSAGNSPTVSRFSRSLPAVTSPTVATVPPPRAADVPMLPGSEDTHEVDWGTWPPLPSVNFGVPAGNFDDLGGDEYGGMLALSDADFSFFDDAPSAAAAARAIHAPLPDTPNFGGGAGVSPHFMGSPSFPPSALNPPSVPASGLSPSTPSGGNGEGKTPFTPFASTTVDTDQTDPAIGPSPYSPAHPLPPLIPPTLLHLPSHAENGFGAIDFDDDAPLTSLTNGVSPPDHHHHQQSLGLKRKRTRSDSVTLRHGFTLRKSTNGGGGNGKASLTTSTKDCICPPRWRPLTSSRTSEVGSGVSPASVSVTSPTLYYHHHFPERTEVDEAGSEDELADAEDDDAEEGEEEEDESIGEPALPMLGPSFLRLHTSGAAVLVAEQVRVEQTERDEAAKVEVSKAVAAKKATPMTNEERIRLEMRAAIVTEGLLAARSPPATSSPSDLSLSVARLLDTTPETAPFVRIDPPQIRCARQSTVLDLDLDVIPLWTKLNLSSWTGGKSLQTFVVCIDREGATGIQTEALQTCLKRLGEVYEEYGLGTHIIGAASHGCEVDGIVRLPGPIVGNEEAITSLREFAKRVSQSGARQNRQTLFYLIAPSPLDVHAIIDGVASLQVLGYKMNVTPLAASTADELTALFDPPPLGQLNRATQIVLTTYDRLYSVANRMRLKPAEMAETPWPDTRLPLLAPLLGLSFPLESTTPLPRFDFKWPNPQLNMLQRDRVLHTAYIVTTDRSWVAVAVMDDRSEEQLFRAHYLGAPITASSSEVEAKTRQGKLCEHVVRAALEKAHNARIEWSVAVWCVGPVKADEMQTFAAAFESALMVAKIPLDFTLGSLQLANDVTPCVEATTIPRASDLVAYYPAHSLPIDSFPPTSQALAGSFSLSRILSRFSSITYNDTLHPQYLLHLLHRTTLSTSSRHPAVVDEAHLHRLTSSVGRLACLRRATQPCEDRTLPWIMAVVQLFADEVVNAVSVDARPVMTLTLPSTGMLTPASVSAISTPFPAPVAA